MPYLSINNNKKEQMLYQINNNPISNCLDNNQALEGYC